MTQLLARLIGRIPVGWLQLIHNRARLAAALAGIGFAAILVFVQLGIMGSLNNSIQTSYHLLDADIMISAEDANTFTEGSNVAQQWLFQALADPGVASGAGLYLGNVTWTEPGNETSFQVLAISPERSNYLAPAIAQRADVIRLPDVAIIDYATRGLDPDRIAQIRPQSPLEVELSDQRVRLANSFAGGAGFAADGYMVMSDQTFLRLFPARSSGAPDHILLKTDGTVSVEEVITRLRATLPEGLRIRSVDQAADDDQRYQTTERPTGLIFGFGVVMGVIVGIVIVYQILSTDVADHLSEYATLKAMGYGSSFFLGIVFEQAIVLAVMGFVPSWLISAGLYELLRILTGLPMQLTPETIIAVFLGTLAACTLSGAIATRRLNSADPADLF